jgi:hypothetical protein
MKKVRYLAAVVGAALMIAAPAEAQVRQVSVGFAAGPSFALGALGDNVNTGWHAQGSVALAPVTLPFGVRADLFYQRFTEADAGHEDHRITTLAGILNGVFALGGFGLRPYASVGAGVYNTTGEHEVDATDIGINAGLGAQFGLGGLNAFIEGKFHNVFATGEAMRFIPISIGIMF